MSHETAVLVFRILAGCSYLVMLSSPSLNIYRVHKARSVGVQSIFPLMALLANSHLWMMYGYLAKIYFPVFSCFLMGDFAAVIYLTIYYRYSDNRRYVVRSIATVVAILFILTLYAILGGSGVTNQTRHEVSTVLGFFADFASVCLYCAPMEKLYMVLKHKSAAFINLPMVLAGYMNNMIWLTFGSLLGNWFMISINIFFTMNSFTLVVYHIFDPKTHPLEEGWDKKVVDENENTEKYPLKEDTFLNEDDQDEEFVVIQVSENSPTAKKVEVPILQREVVRLSVTTRALYFTSIISSDFSSLRTE